MAEEETIVKKEPVEAVDLETRILELCKQNPDGVDDSAILVDMPQFDANQRVQAINRLLSTAKIDLLKSGNKLVYKLKDPSSASVVKGSDNQEKVVYQIIKEAGNRGIWIRDIRYQSNLLLTQVNKILKNLESKKLIKAVKSVAASKKKVYMLYELEPDRSVTGGAWYSDQDFESEFVEVLNQQCFKYLNEKAANARETLSTPIMQRNASFASSTDVWKYISELGISKVKLAVEDIETILDTLIYDGKVERSIVAGPCSSSGASGSITKLYRAIKPLIQPTGLTRMPCGTCPVFHLCSEDGVISPTSCIYMKEWLDY
ncbi:DNA-directed RNA polymerase III subunit RPC6-like [Octopus vulgaris]|uniref:DNA-directed RNA polymerase III subunit RPC6-like n=2 Tax=Octopus TaxID=6643 RepID=A0AA36AZL4_OCTVU|nr:DNA-directed RNA polymerase III subunit RPC6 [Octopus sinensis]CAI9725220.1 DNA-directed RNA polymerase III subunit RPC6-like [Octopus vulgaris]